MEMHNLGEKSVSIGKVEKMCSKTISCWLILKESNDLHASRAGLSFPAPGAILTLVPFFSLSGCCKVFTFLIYYKKYQMKEISNL